MLAEHRKILDDKLHSAARTLGAARAAIPNKDGMARLIADARRAQERGYFTPEEDETLRAAYSNYLGVRASLWEMVDDLLSYVDLPRQFKKGDWQSHLRAFAISFAGASLLVRSGYYLIDAAKNSPIVRDKLDEAEPRYGIERKQFTKIYDSLMSTMLMVRYRRAHGFYRRNKDEIFGALDAGIFLDVAQTLKEEEPHFNIKFRENLKRKARFNLFSLKRRRLSAVSKSMFFMFEAMGSDIADLKQPLVKAKGAPKRISEEVRAQMLEFVRPGDVFVTRHDDAMSNLFLPGYWPHAALYIGTDKQRAAMGVGPSDPAHQHAEGIVRFLESKKDGVLFRPFEDTLQVDACVILRPRFSEKDMAAALTRALSHSGKLYDFVFDFASADRLACTELVYRSYDGFGDIDFKLSERAGRQCLSAEDLLNQGVGNDWLEVVALYGVGNNLLSRGDEARKRLLGSYAYNGA